MTDDELRNAVASLAQRLVALAATDEGLRADLRALAGAFLAATERPTAPEPAPPVERPEAAEPAPPEAAREQPPRAGNPLPELTLGKSRPPEEDHRPEPRPAAARATTADADLPAIEARCRLKAEGVRWAATRHRRLEEGAEFRVEIAPRDREILDRAKDLDTYLWMNTPDFALPREPAVLEDVAGCFEAVADAVALVRGMLPDVEANREFFEKALDLLAEAQSMLRVAVERVDGPHDPDQFRIYDWLRGVAAREQIYISRHMRLDDPAHPALLPEIEDRIEALDTRMQEVRARAKRRKSHLSRLRYHAKLIREGKGTGHDWRKVAGAVDEMLGEGVPPSSVEVRDVLLPILDQMPDLDDLPPGFGLALREIDRYLAGRMSSPDVAPAEAPAAEVVEVARLLSGKAAVLIGGNRRPEAHDALKAAFGLKELHWVETREHESIDRFEPFVARPEVALVLLAIRWSSHAYGEVKRFCDEYGKPLVRLPGGYNPNQVAAQVLAQCSEQLGAA